MRIQKTCGMKSRGHSCHGLPGGGIMAMGHAVAESLKGRGKNKLPPSYGKSFNPPLNGARGIIRQSS